LRRLKGEERWGAMLVFMGRAVSAEDSTKTKDQKWKMLHTSSRVADMA